MAVILRSDPLSRIHPEPQTLEIDHFDYLPDSILLLVFNKIGDVKALGRCCVVSKRFHSLVPQVENVVVRVDCVISDDESSSLSSDKPRSVAAGPFSAIFRLVFGSIFKPLQALGQFLGTKRSSPSSGSSSSSSSLSISGGGEDGEIEQGGVTHHSPMQVLKNFDEIRFLRIELPSGELGIDDGVFFEKVVIFKRFVHCLSMCFKLLCSKAGCRNMLRNTSYKRLYTSYKRLNMLRYESLPGFFNRKVAKQSAAEVALQELAKSSELTQRVSPPVARGWNLLSILRFTCRLGWRFSLHKGSNQWFA